MYLQKNFQRKYKLGVHSIEYSENYKFVESTEIDGLKSELKICVQSSLRIVGEMFQRMNNWEWNLVNKFTPDTRVSDISFQR